MKKTFLLLLALALPCSAQAEQVTLRNAVERALLSNAELHAARYRVDAKKANSAAAFSRYYPEVTVDLAYTHLGQAMVIDLDPIRTAMIELQTSNNVTAANLESAMKTGKPLSAEMAAEVEKRSRAGLNAKLPAFKETVKRQNYPSAQFTIKQPIYTGGKISAGVEAGEKQERIEELGAERVRVGEVKTVVSYYINATLARENAQLREKAYNQTLNHAERARKFEAQGLIAKTETLRAEVALAEAKRKLAEAREKYELALTALGSEINLKPEEIELADSLSFKDMPLDYAALESALLANNPGVGQLKAAAEALEAKSKAEKADFFPTVFAFGQYNAFDQYRSLIEPEWAVGVGAKYELFNGLRNSDEYQSAKSEAEAAKLTQKDAETKLKLALKSSLTEAGIARENYVALDASEAQAEESLRLNQKRFETGLGTSLEVIDAQLTLESISLKKAEAVSEYYKNAISALALANLTDVFFENWNK